MKRFEYKSISYSPSLLKGYDVDKINEEITKLGKEGWELISSVQLLQILVS